MFYYKANNVAHLLTGATMSHASRQYFWSYLIKYCDYFNEWNELILWLKNSIVDLIFWSFKNNQGDIWIVKGWVAPIWRSRDFNPLKMEWSTPQMICSLIHVNLFQINEFERSQYWEHTPLNKV